MRTGKASPALVEGIDIQAVAGSDSKKPVEIARALRHREIEKLLVLVNQKDLLVLVLVVLVNQRRLAIMTA